MHRVAAVAMDPAGLVLKLSPEAALAPFETSASEHFVLAHHGIARCGEEGWTLTVDGLVGQQLALSLADLRALGQVTVTAAIECAGNPEDPDKPTRFVGNARWSG